MPIRPDDAPEARELRDARRQRRRLQADDPLAKRARLVAGWKVANAAHAAEWGIPECTRYVSSIYGHPGFRRLVLPGVRALLDARERAHRERIAAETRDFDARRRAAKAAAARAPAAQAELF